jgi:hypothetical protein
LERRNHTILWGAELKTILFELNEVPWRVMDTFCDEHPDSAFAQIRKSGKSFETTTEDQGDLHPWVTWPGLHRGVSNHRHGIAHLGQDLSETNEVFPPVWTLLQQQGVPIGIGGSLQSYPVPQNRKNIDFYIPDTFSPGPETIPASLSAFQGVSLGLTKQNGRNVQGGVGKDVALKLVGSMTRIGLSPSTALEITSQLVRERSDKSKLNRRRAMQSALYFDAFMKQLRASKPGFATFFTNHVAASLHRFWAAKFPGDYHSFSLSTQWRSTYSGEIDWAMQMADGFAQRLMRFCRANPDYSLLVCSSMGQGPTTADVRNGVYQLKNVTRLFDVCGIPADAYRETMAMAPDLSVHLLTDHVAERVKAVLADLAKTVEDTEWDIDQRNMLHVRSVLPFDPEAGLPDVMIGNRSYTFEEIGMEFVPDQDGVALTAYHVPEGIMMAWRPSVDERNWTRESVSVLEVAPAILMASGVTPPDYMRSTSITLN